MARQVLPIVGAVVGAYFGYPQAGFMVGSILGQLVDPAIAQGPQLGELPVQTSNEGSPRAIIYGTATCTGYILAFGEALKTQEVQTGEKGASKTDVNVVYRSFAIAICEGPIGALLRVWENDKLVYDARPGSLMVAESAKWMENKFLYLGDEEQVPNVFMEQTISGVGTTPAYRGTAYFYANLEDLTETAGAIKQYRFEVAGAAALEPVDQPLIVYPWVDGTVDPRDSRNTHTYKFTGFPGEPTNVSHYPTSTWSTRNSLGLALLDMYADWNAGHSNTPLMSNAHLIGNSDDFYHMRPAFGSGGVLQKTMVLHFNEVTPTAYSSLLSSTPAGSVPNLTSGTLWGLNYPLKQSVGYRTTPSSWIGPQWSNLDRLYAAETYGVTSGGLQTFYVFDGAISCERVPIPPTGSSLIVGTAKQLGIIEYRSGQLYQNGVGPVILPSDPRYSDTAFWSAARTAAITAGTLASDVTSPVVVASYASGYDTVIGEPVALSSILSDLHQRSAIPEADFDVSELTGIMVGGLTLTGDYTAGDAINTLRSCYFFDKSEPGDKLYYPLRGKPVVVTLDFDDLVDVPDLSKREQVGEVPKKLHLMYQNSTAGYAPVKASYERSSVDVLSVVETTMQVPVVLDVDEAQQMVHKQMKVMTAEAQGEIKLTLPDRLIGLIPSDNIGLSLRGQVRRLRIDECEWADGVLSLTLRTDRQSAYTSNLTGIAIPEPALPPSTIVGETTFVFADVPSRSDTEDDLHYLVAGVGAMPGWYGWELQRSLDAGANYESVEQFTSADVVGTLIDPVPSTLADYTDTTSTVRVQLYNSNHTLEDLTDVQFLSEGGAFLLEKADGSYEVMQYRDATDEGSGIFSLTTLHRGCLNSGADTHSAGARFVLLSSAHHVPAQSSWIGKSMTHRPVSISESPEAAAEQINAYVGRSQLEWPVASFKLTRSGNNVTGTWAPRHRFGTDDAPIASANFQGYRVAIVGTSTVTFDQTAATFTYDVSAIGGAVTVSVSALNRITGAGPATSGAI
jgi:hypothetical protein